MFDRLLLALFTAAAYAGLIARSGLVGDGSVIWNEQAPGAIGAGKELFRWWKYEKANGKLKVEDF